MNCWIDWLGALHRLGVEERTISGANSSLVQVLIEFGGGSIGKLAGVLIGLASIAVVAISRGKSRLFATAAIGSILPLLAAPVAWLHYYIFCVPMLLLMARPIAVEPERALNGIIRYAIAGTCFIAMSIAPIFAIDDLESIAIRMSGVAVVLYVFGAIRLLTPVTSAGKPSTEPSPDLGPHPSES